jgi:hypothetical protein
MTCCDSAARQQFSHHFQWQAEDRSRQYSTLSAVSRGNTTRRSKHAVLAGGDSK